MKNKKWLIIVATTLIVCTMMAGCKDTEPTINIYVPDGAPSLALAYLMQNPTAVSGYKVNISIVSGDAVVGKMLSGDADFAILPTNAGAKLYNNGVNIKMLSANLWGLLYMVGKNDITTYQELAGKVVYSIGKGNTPEFVFKNILDSKQVPYREGDTPLDGVVTIKYADDAGSILPLLIQNLASYAILGEPAVSQALTKGQSKIFDLQKDWSIATNTEHGYPQAAIFARGEMLSDTQLITELITSISGREDWLTSNATSLKGTLKAFGSALNVEYTPSIITACNIQTVLATEAKARVNKYLEILLKYAPNSVGGKLPSDEFYYSA